MSKNGVATETEPMNRLLPDGTKFPEKPSGGYALRADYAQDRIVTWEAILHFHGDKNGNVKEGDRKVAVGTRNAVIDGCEVDRASGSVAFVPGWMHFKSGEQVDHLLKCFAWQLSDKGPGIPLEKMVIADPIIDALKVLSAKAEADLATAKAKLLEAAAVEAAKSDK